MKQAQAYLILFLHLLLCLAQAGDKIIAKIQSGVDIQGSEMTTLTGRKILSFRGIPYAEPPVGKLRFKAPVEKKWTTKFFDATKDGAKCTQGIMRYTNLPVNGQEDCLFLNVYTHDTSSPLRKVMVFIHGGAFCVGAGDSTTYGPRRLLDRGVVLVTLNYRLGPLGFLSTGDEAAPGNFGLLDQTEALKWVQKNIAAFGGDPNKVTLFGESAGSASVMNHLLSPVSKGLFHRAIAHSANPLCPFAEQLDPLSRTKLLAKNVGCQYSDTNKMVECLRTVSADKITQTGFALQNEGILTAYGPVNDGHFHSELPSQIFSKGQLANNVPLLMGITKDEGLMFMPWIYTPGTKLTEELIKTLISTTLNIETEKLQPEVTKLVKAKYFNYKNKDDHILLQSAISDVISYGAFIADHYRAVETLLSHGIKPFLYSYDYLTDHTIMKIEGCTDIRGVAHVDDLHFLFDMQEYFPYDYNTPNDDTENKFLDIWTNFAENGYPMEESENGHIEWQSAKPGKIQVYHLNQVITTENYDPKKDCRITFWTNQILPLLNKTNSKLKDEL